MVKKLQKMAEKQAASGSASGLFDSALAGTVRESAQQIWLAGLGAFSKAQAEGGKVFEALVKEGTHLQKKTQSAAEEKIGEMTNRMTSMAGDVSARAGQHWDKLESIFNCYDGARFRAVRPDYGRTVTYFGWGWNQTIFEDRTAKAMNKLGVPMKKDVDALVERIDALAAKVAALSRTPVAKKAATRQAAAPAAKRAPRKRAG